MQRLFFDKSLHSCDFEFSAYMWKCQVCWMSI